MGVLSARLRGASTPPFSTLFAVNFRTFPDWAAMLKTEAKGQREEMGQSTLARMENEVLSRPYGAWYPYTVVVPIHRAIWQTTGQPKRFNSASTPCLARHGLLYEKPFMFRACRS
jgi:hypothetical protein